MDFSSAADELYGVPPAAFVAARKRLARRARDAGDRSLAGRIDGLRRPTVSAWAVNLLARSAAEDLGRLLDAGAEIRAAWGSGGGLGDLERRRARLVVALVRTAGDLVAGEGGHLREQAVREVEDTLMAATVDADIAAEVREGRLSRPRSHTGFVPAAFSPAPGDGERPAKPTAAVARATKKKAEAKAERAADDEDRSESSAVTRTSAARRRRAAAARRRAEAAERRLAEREERAAAARREAEEASAEVGRLRRALEKAVAARDAAVRRAERAEQGRDRAREEAREARRAAREAREAAERDARQG